MAPACPFPALCPTKSPEGLKVACPSKEELELLLGLLLYLKITVPRGKEGGDEEM